MRNPARAIPFPPRVIAVLWWGLLFVGLVTSVAAQTNVQPAAAPENAAPAGAQQIVPPPPRPSTPPPVGLSGRVTDWLQIRGEFRGRLEGLSSVGYAPDASNGYWLDRFRINATIAPTPALKFVVQAHDARAFNKASGGQTVPFRDTLDLRMAYGEYDTANTSVRIGRQELFFGEQRLIGHVSWLNTARSFDGARATFKTKKFQFDAIAMSVVTIDPSGFDTSGKGNFLTGVYGASNAVIPQAAVEPYMFWRQSRGLAVESGGTGNLHQATVGLRIVGKLPSQFDYGTEMAVQGGSVATDDVRAWAGHWVMGRTFASVPTNPRLFGEFNYASGDKNPKDGTRGTFDQLYPTGHDKYGLADQVGWRNIEHVRGGIELKPAAQWQVTGGYHTWWLADPHDALYSAGGAVIARSPTGVAGRRVGQEVDAQASYTYSAQLQIAGGYAYLLPGEFLKATTPGHTYGFSYLMITYVFVGERPAPPGGPAR